MPGGRKQQPMSTSRKVRATLLAHATAAYSANRSTPGSVHTALRRATPGRRGTKATPQVFGATNLPMWQSASAPEPDQHRQLHHCVLQRAAPAQARADDIFLAAGALHCLRAPRCSCIGRRSAVAGHPARCLATKKFQCLCTRATGVQETRHSLDGKRGPLATCTTRLTSFG